MTHPHHGTVMPAAFHPVNDNTEFPDDFTGPEIRSGLAEMAGLCRRPELRPQPDRAAAIIGGLAVAIVLSWGAGADGPPPESIRFLGFEEHEIFRHWADALTAAKFIAQLSNLTIPEGAFYHDADI